MIEQLFEKHEWKFNEWLIFRIKDTSLLPKMTRNETQDCCDNGDQNQTKNTFITNHLHGIDRMLFQQKLFISVEKSIENQ